ncbi:MAG: hypothetical protein V2A73_20940 [Pseudomonadota bacterium]
MGCEDNSCFLYPSTFSTNWQADITDSLKSTLRRREKAMKRVKRRGE